MKLYIINPMYTSLFLVIVLSAYVSSLSLYITGGKTYLNNEYEIIYGAPRNVITKIDGAEFGGVKRLRKLTQKEKIELNNLSIKQKENEKKRDEERRQKEEEKERQRLEKEEEKRREQEEKERERERKEEEERQREQEEKEKEREQEEEEKSQREQEEKESEMQQEEEERERERKQDEEERQREQEEKERERKQEEEKRRRKQKMGEIQGIRGPRRNTKKPQRKTGASQYEMVIVQSNSGQQIRRTLSNKQNTPLGRSPRRKNVYVQNN